MLGLIHTFASDQNLVPVLMTIPWKREDIKYVDENNYFKEYFSKIQN